MEDASSIQIYQRGINGHTYYVILENNKQIFTTFVPGVEENGDNKKAEEIEKEEERRKLEHLKKVKIYLVSNFPEITKNLVSF
jgi:hypothetical protein